MLSLKEKKMFIFLQSTTPILSIVPQRNPNPTSSALLMITKAIQRLKKTKLNEFKVPKPPKWRKATNPWATNEPLVSTNPTRKRGWRTKEKDFSKPY